MFKLSFVLKFAQVIKVINYGSISGGKNDIEFF